MGRWIGMSGALSALALTLLPIVAGCSDDDPVVVDTPPFPPDGVFSETGDGQVTIFWNPNWESDLTDYGVYRSDASDGSYSHLSDVPASRVCDGYWVCYTDTDVINGETWYYAVTALDAAGNESDLSYEDVFDTPRPEGSNLILFDYTGQNRGLSGYDFSNFVNGTAQPDTATTTDVFYGAAAGVNYLWTTSRVDIQDYGLIKLPFVDWAPVSGWAPSGRVEAIVGHSYIVRIADVPIEHYAKVYVKSVSNAGADPDTRNVTLDWAYQPVSVEPHNRELSPGFGGGASR
jgi:hypothetical protein